MGTRSLTVINDSAGKEFVTLYRQMDGYPTGHGADLKAFLLPFTITTGVRLMENRKTANGMECLAAQIVAHFKKGPGDIYLYPAGTRDCGEEWVYAISGEGEDKGLRLTVQAGDVTFFGLPGTKQANMPTLFDGPIADFDPEKVEEAYDNMEKPVNDFLNEQEAKRGA